MRFKLYEENIYQKHIPKFDEKKFKDDEVSMDNVYPGMVYQHNEGTANGWSTDWFYVLSIRPNKGPNGGKILDVLDKEKNYCTLYFNVNDKLYPRPDKLAAFGK